MFEMKREYPAAVADYYSDPEGAISRALAWLMEKRRQVGGQVLLWAPGKQNVTYNRRLHQLSTTAGVVTMTPRSRHSSGWSGGVVLAAWPSAEQLALLAEDPRSRALCVLAHSEADVRAWRRAAKAELLGDSGPFDAAAVEASTTLDPVVVKALTSVTHIVNQSNALTGYSRDAAAQALLMLRDGEHNLPPEEIYSWVLDQGWSAVGAARLKALAEQVNSGSRPRIRERQLRTDSLQRWRLEAKEDLKG